MTIKLLQKLNNNNILSFDFGSSASLPKLKLRHLTIETDGKKQRVSKKEQKDSVPSHLVLDHVTITL